MTQQVFEVVGVNTAEQIEFCLVLIINIIEEENSSSFYPASMKHLFPWKTGLSRDSRPPVLARLPWFARVALKPTATVSDTPTREQSRSMMEQESHLGSRLATDPRRSLRHNNHNIRRSLKESLSSSSQRRRTLSPGSPLDPATLPPTATGSPWRVEKV